ncbi:hypothetical protein F4808DRAFT_252757 [Astrocystis sublimbata]|nr:hypothetical protein F4808DRAFT_252757 [Astrocystis sublimbata]
MALCCQWLRRNNLHHACNTNKQGLFANLFSNRCYQPCMFSAWYARSLPSTNRHSDTYRSASAAHALHRFPSRNSQVCHCHGRLPFSMTFETVFESFAHGEHGSEARLGFDYGPVSSSSVVQVQAQVHCIASSSCVSVKDYFSWPRGLESVVRSLDQHSQAKREIMCAKESLRAELVKCLAAWAGLDCVHPWHMYTHENMHHCI